MKDPFAPKAAPRIKPVEVPGFPAPLDLRVVASEGSGTSEIEATLTVGRKGDNDVALKGGSFPSVSSYHAKFELRAGALWVVDLDSKNGVLVGGEPVDGERKLQLGDQVRLGSVGPKFLVVGARSLEETVFVRKESVRKGAKREVEKIIGRANRRTTQLISLLGIVLLAAIAVIVWDRSTTREQQESRDLAYGVDIRDASEQIAALEARELLREQEATVLQAQRVEQIAQLEKNLAQRTAELETTLAQRSKDEQALVQRIAGLEQTGASREVLERVERDLQSARTEITKTRDDLTAARRRVDLFDPVNLAQARLSGVARVRSSIVLIENEVKITNLTTDTTMHLEFVGSGADRTVRPNYDDRGEEFSLDSTGSGFCIHPDGWIITNAHVVASPNTSLVRELAAPKFIEQTVELNVVFSGTSTRYAAKIHAIAEGDVDLALIKIEPFKGMPNLQGFRTDASPPVPGSDISLFGFPLGHLAVQEGETVIASTFRGILSRNVGGQMQVDAGVHPGNSGGPITDAAGRVVGIVVSVQAGPDREAVYAIGYGIPIADANSIWPPAALAKVPDPAPEIPTNTEPSEAAELPADDSLKDR